MPPSTAERKWILINTLGVLDGAGAAFSPGSLLLEVGGAARARILAVGRTGDVARHPAVLAGQVERIDRPRSILIPGLVNAHTHLDLTHLGPRPYDAERGFVGWVDMIRRARHLDPADIATSVKRGIELSLGAGVVAVGDIAGAAGGRPNLAPFRALQRDGRLGGVSFLEFFGVGATQDRAFAAVEHAVAEAGAHRLRNTTVRLGLQPHAPNTVASTLYRRVVDLAATHGLPLATHLAETPEEREFVAHARGPQRTLLESVGVWDDSILTDVGHGRTPADHLSAVLAAAAESGRPFLCAHVNDADDQTIETLARTGTRVAYCPRASAYFGAERAFGAHRYGEMLDAGITVALGTDSIVNLPTGCGSTPSESPTGRGLSVLDEMRFLYDRDATPPEALLRMGSLNGAAALGLPIEAFCLSEGFTPAAVVAVEVLGSDTPAPAMVPHGNLGSLLLGGPKATPELLWNGNSYCQAENKAG